MIYTIGGSTLELEASATPGQPSGYRMFFEHGIEGASFIAALSRHLSSLVGISSLSRSDEIEVRSRALPNDQLELYLSASAMEAAITAFSPVPPSGVVSFEALPEDCTLLIQGSAPAWGVEDAQNHL